MTIVFKYNDISSFLKKNHDSYILKEYNIKLAKILKKAIRNLTNNNYGNIINECVIYSYDNHYDDLVKKLGFEHPALKYLAIEETKEMIKYSKILFENNINDINILTKNLKKHVRKDGDLNMVVENIMNRKIKLSLPGAETPIKMAKNIFEMLSFESDFSKSSIASSMFSIIHSGMNKENEKYIQTIIKYIL